jgi:hypothetical protein
MSPPCVLGAMSDRSHCERTGLSIPECSCRRCCQAQLRRHGAPSRSVAASPDPGTRPSDPFDPGQAIWIASEYAAQSGLSTAQLIELARTGEVS